LNVNNNQLVSFPFRVDAVEEMLLCSGSHGQFRLLDAPDGSCDCRLRPFFRGRGLHVRRCLPHSFIFPSNLPCAKGLLAKYRAPCILGPVFRKRHPAGGFRVRSIIPLPGQPCKLQTLWPFNIAGRETGVYCPVPFRPNTAFCDGGCRYASPPRELVHFLGRIARGEQLEDIPTVLVDRRHDLVSRPLPPFSHSLCHSSRRRRAAPDILLGHLALGIEVSNWGSREGGAGGVALVSLLRLDVGA
ncbi:hypothetical protein CI238_07497, partial [Colletotrichum incanum]